MPVYESGGKFYYRMVERVLFGVPRAGTGMIQRRFNVGVLETTPKKKSTGFASGDRSSKPRQSSGTRIGGFKPLANHARFLPRRPHLQRHPLLLAPRGSLVDYALLVAPLPLVVIYFRDFARQAYGVPSLDVALDRP